jgi:hypothetical protein
MSNFVDHPFLLILIVILSFPVYRILGLVFFDSKEEFIEALRYWATPDVWSLFKGRHWEDWDAEFKLFVYISICIGFVAAIYQICIRYFI